MLHICSGNLITWQKVDYDFKFHSLEYETDIPVLVSSRRFLLLVASLIHYKRSDIFIGKGMLKFLVFKVEKRENFVIIFLTT